MTQDQQESRSHRAPPRAGRGWESGWWNSAETANRQPVPKARAENLASGATCFGQPAQHAWPNEKFPCWNDMPSRICTVHCTPSQHQSIRLHCRYRSRHSTSAIAASHAEAVFGNGMCGCEGSNGLIFGLACLHTAHGAMTECEQSTLLPESRVKMHGLTGMH